MQLSIQFIQLIFTLYLSLPWAAANESDRKSSGCWAIFKCSLIYYQTQLIFFRNRRSKFPSHTSKWMRKAPQTALVFIYFIQRRAANLKLVEHVKCNALKRVCRGGLQNITRMCFDTVPCVTHGVRHSHPCSPRRRHRGEASRWDFLRRRTEGGGWFG